MQCILCNIKLLSKEKKKSCQQNLGCYKLLSAVTELTSIGKVYNGPFIRNIKWQISLMIGCFDILAACLLFYKEITDSTSGSCLLFFLVIQSDLKARISKILVGISTEISISCQMSDSERIPVMKATVFFCNSTSECLCFIKSSTHRNSKLQILVMCLYTLKSQKWTAMKTKPTNFLTC